MSLLLQPVRADTAQNPPPASQRTIGARDAKLGSYLDVESGFDLLLPHGWTYDNSRVPAADRALSVFRGADPTGQKTVQILVYQGRRIPDFSDWVANYAKNLANASGSFQVEAHPRTVVARPAARINVEQREKGAVRGAQHLVVLVDPMQVFVFVLTQPGHPVHGADAVLFNVDILAETLHFSAKPIDAAAADDAFRRGRALIAMLRTSGQDVQFDREPAHYRITIGGSPVGYLSRRLSAEDRLLDAARSGKNTMPGLRLIEQTWTFEADGTARMVGVDAFASFDGRSEAIEERIVHIPAPQLKDLRPLIKLDEVIREDDVLFSSASRNTQQNLPAPRPPIIVDANYLSRAWWPVLPGFLADVREQPHAFTGYDAATRALRPLWLNAWAAGAAASQPGSDNVDADSKVEFEFMQQFGSPSASLSATRAGRMLRLADGETIYEWASIEAVEAEFGARRREAERRFYAAGDKAGENRKK